MYRFLIISPISIAGVLIIKGLAKGFEQLGHRTLMLDVRELDPEIIGKFNPDYVISYDYGHFVDTQAEKIVNNLNIPVIHYFADGPDANFAHSGNLELPEKLADSNNVVFCWDKQYLGSLRNETHYLPLGVDPELYSVKNNCISEMPDIAFVGRPLTIKRQTLLADIIKNFPDKLSIYSYKKHFDTSVKEIQKMELLSSNLLEFYKNSYKGFLETEQELANVYANSKIVLNITMEQGFTSMNYRVLEVLASGGFLLTDYKQDTADYFLADEEVVFYRNNEELIEKISKYLEDNLRRIKIAQNGREKVLKYHTFKQRAEEILRKIS